MRKPLLIIGIVILAAIIGFYAFNSYIYNQKQADPKQEIKSYRGTLTGEYVCLPHKDQSGPQTLECRYGMQTDAGEYYAVDFMLSSQQIEPFQVGDRFTASGTITPIEMLSTNTWDSYPIKGIFSVTDSVQKIN